MGFAALTRVLKRGNQIGDAGACRLGETLEVNRSLEALNIVSLFSVYFCYVGGLCREKCKGVIST